jgi:hypothetical protein
VSTWRHIQCRPPKGREQAMAQWLDRNVGGGNWQHSFGPDGSDDPAVSRRYWIAFHPSVPETLLILFTLRWFTDGSD